MNAQIDRRNFLAGAAAATGAVLFSPILSSCGTKSSAPGATKTLNVAVLPEFVTLDPDHLASTEDGIMDTIFDPLIYMSPKTLKPEPWLAKSWAWSPDFHELTIQLRSGVKFHDGTAMDADAVAANFKRALNPKTGDSMASTLGALKSVRASRNAVILTLREPNPSVLGRLTWFKVMSPDSFDHAKNSPVGTGPFALKKWNPGRDLTVTRNKSYWRKSSTPLEEITYTFFQDQNTQLNSVFGGQTDLLLNGLPRDAKQLKGRGWKVYSRVKSDYLVLYLNATKEALSDNNLRQAIARAIDRSTINSVAYAGLGEPLTIPVPKDSASYDPQIAAQWDYDLSAARQYLAKSGVSHPSFTVTIDSSAQDQKQGAEIIQASLRKIGVEMRINSVDPNTFTKIGLDGDYEGLIWYASGGIIDPGDFEDNSGYRMPPEGVIWKNHAPKSYVSAYQSASSQTDAQQRAAAFKKVWQALHELAFALPVTWRGVMQAQSPAVSGVHYDVNARLMPQDIRFSG